MRTLDRNKRNICYALCEGKIARTDVNGDFTGDDKVVYSKPEHLLMNYSETRGHTRLEPFGIQETYTVTAVTSDMDCPIDVDSIIWLDMNPEMFDVEHVYNVGDLVFYGNSIFRCKKQGGSIEDLVPPLTSNGETLTTDEAKEIEAMIGYKFDPDAWEEVPRNYIVIQRSPTLNHISYVLQVVK